MDNYLISTEKTLRTLHFWYCFAQLEKLYTAQSTDHLLRIVAEWNVDVVLLQVGLKCFSMRTTSDLVDELLNAENFCYFHDCMWQSWYPEVNVYYPRAEWTIVHPWVLPFLFDLRLRICLQFVQALTRNSGWILVHPRLSPFLLGVWCLRDQTGHLFRSPVWTVVHPRVSPFLIIGFLVLVGFVGCPCCFQLLLNPILSYNYLWRKSSVVVEKTQKLSGIWPLQIPSQLLSRSNKLGMYRTGWLHYILFDRPSIFFVEQAV